MFLKAVIGYSTEKFDFNAAIKVMRSTLACDNILEICRVPVYCKVSNFNDCDNARFELNVNY
jgi:hypothetical protein